ncbi:hypothetical protein BTHERMOSOX_1032 [Bathymodiolus thermophilus thioautotrophic gill symbiont]|uniref:Uncharacterized protein n=1 Tax=Bathymodiolus thermophilus thioautotrophic gill symbiont TaxID=2360 RepID=A0A8H8XCD0_9GAMM|nr:hypothetical protein THERMOS_318 [Bathymodiolus thermophilus thioautotrophic gill symbiont]SHA29578.1 hypothetical protein BTHERMOSOX_1032 [Bathymodiolus thermophilus thioautotrophic gill symbiont]
MHDKNNLIFAQLDRELLCNDAPATRFDPIAKLVKSGFFDGLLLAQRSCVNNSC